MIFYRFSPFSIWSVAKYETNDVSNFLYEFKIFSNEDSLEYKMHQKVLKINIGSSYSIKNAVLSGNEFTAA